MGEVSNNTKSLFRKWDSLIQNWKGLISSSGKKIEGCWSKKSKINITHLAFIKKQTKQNFEVPITRNNIKYELDQKFLNLRGISNITKGWTLKKKLLLRFRILAKLNTRAMKKPMKMKCRGQLFWFIEFMNKALRWSF